MRFEHFACSEAASESAPVDAYSSPYNYSAYIADDWAIYTQTINLL